MGGALGVVINESGTTLTIQYDNANITYYLPETLPSDTWTYFVLSRSGTTENMWMNSSGHTFGSQTDSVDYTGNTEQVGFFGSPLTGKIADLKVNLGSTNFDPSLSTITVPTSKLTADVDTVMLYNVNTPSTFLTDSSGNQSISTQTNVAFSTDSPYPH